MGMKVALDVVDRRRREPLYLQLAKAITGAIREGHYGPGERIPSEREFMREGRLSYPTVAQAFREVVKAGWVRRKVGSGTFVADPLP
ncbi:MAG: GntR family transcriptional regulator, partial [Candidatus Hydrogenedentes bacterium]|nr:GntR family transcriptional regulator [Candidatus Hydrogenedentota bacterium]